MEKIISNQNKKKTPESKIKNLSSQETEILNNKRNRAVSNDYKYKDISNKKCKFSKCQFIFLKIIY